MSDTTTTPHPGLKMLSDKVRGVLDRTAINLPEKVLSCVMYEGPYMVLFAPEMQLWLAIHEALNAPQAHNEWAEVVLIEKPRLWVEGRTLGLTIIIEGDYTDRLHMDFVVLLD